MKYSKEKKEFLKTLGSRIQNLRRRRGLSQEALSFKCSLHRTYIGGIERGERNVGVVNLKKIADVLQVPLSELFREQEKNC